MKIEQISEKGKVKLLFHNGRNFLLMPLQETENKKFFEYKNFKIQKWNENNEEKTLVEFYDKEFRDDIFEIISSRINEGENLFTILNSLSFLLEKNKKNYLKLRGDFGEAIFLLKNGGTKAMDNETFDIVWKNKYVEIKTYSPQKRTIMITLKQIKENTLKFVVPIYNDSQGINILEISEKIKNTNPDFSNYLEKKYKKSSYLSELKFKICDPVDITNQIDKNIILPSNIVSAKFSIFINLEN